MGIDSKGVFNISKFLFLLSLSVLLFGLFNHQEVLRAATLLEQAFLQTFEGIYQAAYSSMGMMFIDSTTKGIAYNLRDMNMTFQAYSNGTVLVDIAEQVRNSSLTAIYAYDAMGWRENCTSLIGFGTILCPADFKDATEFCRAKIANDINLDFDTQNLLNETCLIPISSSNQSGTLVSYTLAYYPNDAVINTTTKANATLLLMVNASSRTQAMIQYLSARCLKFTIPRWAAINLRVTMPNAISSITYSDGYYTNFLNNSMTRGTTYTATFNPYPCCGKAYDKKIYLEVCS